MQNHSPHAAKKKFGNSPAAAESNSAGVVYSCRLYYYSSGKRDRVP